MKMNKRDIFIVSALVVVALCIVIGIYRYENEIKDYKSRIEELESVSNNNNDEDSNIDNNIDNNEEEYEYDCSFTETYRVVNTLDGYIAEVPELSYIVVDKFQAHGAFTHIIPTKLKEGLEENKYYEFTYHIKGKGNIKNKSDVYRWLSSSALENEDFSNKLSVTLDIKKTDKTGLGQVQENICSHK